MKYTVAPFSGITGCGIFQSGSAFVIAIVPPSLPESLWDEAAELDAVTRRKKYTIEVKQETERLAAIVCDALNGLAIPAAQPAPPTNSVFAGLPNALAREIQDECRHLTCAEGVAFVQSKLDEVSNLSFEAGKVAAQPAPPNDSLYASGVKFLRAALEECAKGKTVTFTADHLQTLTAVFESWSAQPAPGWISVKEIDKLPGAKKCVIVLMPGVTFQDGTVCRDVMWRNESEPWQWTDGEYTYDQIYVTAWQALPAAPPEPAQEPKRKEINV